MAFGRGFELDWHFLSLLTKWPVQLHLRINPITEMVVGLANLWICNVPVLFRIALAMIHTSIVGVMQNRFVFTV
jgi:hypothetical protein